ncbi:hypothetical protein CXZ10_12100 [Pleomorphomonas diazotrophica]|uniref:Uncharacterized protein n=1 Tax=Pleomorphomonas diazotrophica TaxID=1166257 RepID=A0A1I4SCL8_9HYPH|nr:hypothetical protein [Pleomorphomonas diazotrophica]PKR88857.1 hypothetical protein CXZ10_12100 [Pleomorphomonas diazotrophica]SFM62228.1 hypothetical protein SAMN05192571_103235 [Pleomorphomonas diazotrophica]
MAKTAWAMAEGQFDAGDGAFQPARAELSHDGLAIIAADGEPITLWRPADLIRAMVPDGFRIGARRQTGIFVFDPDHGGELIRALASIPDADAPMMPRALISTMVMIVGLALAALFALGWGFFWLIEWLTAPAIPG